MKVFTIADLASNWYPHQAFNQFHRYANIQFVDLPEQADLIWIMSYYLTPASLTTLPRILHKILPAMVHRKRDLRKKPIITTVHHLAPAKKALWLPTIRLLDNLTDFWQTSSHINLPYIKQFTTKPIHVLPYWIDPKTFYPLNLKQKRRMKIQCHLPLNKTIIGSFQRDTESNLKTPKLEKGPDVFCDIVEQLDRDKIFILLTGPRRTYIENRLTVSNTPYRSLGQVSYSAINNLYSTLDYYLVTSRHEGGPQAILEAMATHTKIYSSYVGIADLLSPQVIFKTADQCAAMLSDEYPDVLAQHYAKSLEFSCQKVVPKFESFFQKLIKEYAENKHSLPV